MKRSDTTADRPGWVLALALALAFTLGLAAVAWVGLGYLGQQPLALVMTGLIATAYLSGAAELRRFHQATQGLQQALLTPPQADAGAAGLPAWLDRLHPSLHTAVRLRLEGERQPLPGPTLTPYLVGLLVLLGMLGTFLGMVVTMQGAVLALQGSTDLSAVRDALAAPVQGLGLAFGTSVAGVAASAMLGLMSALCRRQRLRAGQALDRLAAGPLRALSRSHQQALALQALQALQTQTAGLPQLPQLLTHLQDLAQRASDQAQAHAQASHAQLLQRQQAFQHDFQHASLARVQSLGETLTLALQQQVQQALHEGTRLAAHTLQPLVTQTLAGVAQQAAELQHGVAQRLQQQLQAQADGFAQQQAAWLAQLAQTQAAQQARAEAADQQRLAQWSQQLDTSAQALQRTWQQAWADTHAQAQAQQAQVCATLAHTAQALQEQAAGQARDTLAELSRLAAAAAQAPQAAGELVLTLRQQLSDSLANDQRQLAEREQLLQRLGELLDSLQQQGDAQRRATEAGLAAAAAQLQQASTELQARVAADTDRLASAATQLSAGAVEISAAGVDMASLSEAFGVAVQGFASSSTALGAQLQQIEAALARSTARSDEQLAYYVAQARELIELSVSSQQQIVQDLRQLAQPAQATGLAHSGGPAQPAAAPVHEPA